MEVIKYPNSILLRKCEDVSLGDESIPKISDEMLELMYASCGIGLAGPQCGIGKNIVVIDLREEPQKIYKLINPKIVWASEEMIESEEGCLSLPGVTGVLSRHASVSVEYLNENYEASLIEKADGYLSICLQHEIDHLLGKLYINRMSLFKKDRLLQKYKQILSEESLEENNNQNNE